jgi:hypothetical protein
MASVLTVLDLVDARFKYAETYGSLLSGEGGSAGGWRYAAEVLPISFRSLPPPTLN